MDVLPREVMTVSRHEIEPFIQGRKVGYYLLGKTLGEGSFAKVKEAIHILTGEKVAVKIIDKKRAREDRYISKNLRREARILQLVRHANIVQLYEVLETDNYYYLVMEHCGGGELLDYICSRKRLEESTARRLVSQLVSAVDAMHRNGIVHRDLKIENFLLNDEEDLKIIDFGLSNTLPSPCLDNYEKTGVFPQLLNTHCGSPAYAAPELLAQKHYGPQVDIWSIGINMYAMLTGFLPYMMEPFNVMEMYEKMMQRKMTPVPNFLSKECRDLLMRLLEPVPEWRISLKQVMRHKWFTGTKNVPRPVSLGDMMYTKKELCESVLNYMKYAHKIKTKDAINAVVSNRAVHASAVYHLLIQRLDRYIKDKKDIELQSQHFSKVEVIKKASLTNDKIINTNGQKLKKFSFRGRKIDPSSRSQPGLVHDINNNTLDLSLENTSLHKSQVDFDEEIKRSCENNQVYVTDGVNRMDNRGKNIRPTYDEDKENNKGGIENNHCEIKNNNLNSAMEKDETIVANGCVANRTAVTNNNGKHCFNDRNSSMTGIAFENNKNDTDQTNDMIESNNNETNEHRRSVTAETFDIMAEVCENLINSTEKNALEYVIGSPSTPLSPDTGFVTSRKMSYDCIGLDDYFEENQSIKLNPQSIPSEMLDNLPNGKLNGVTEITNNSEGNGREESRVQSSGWFITKIIKQRPLKVEDQVVDKAGKINSSFAVYHKESRATETSKSPVISRTSFESHSSNSASKSQIKHSEKSNKVKTIKRPKTPDQLKTVHPAVRPTTPEVEKTPFEVSQSNSLELSCDTTTSAHDTPIVTSNKPTPELLEVTNNVRYVSKHSADNEEDIGKGTLALSTKDSTTFKSEKDDSNDDQTRTKRTYSLPNSDTSFEVIYKAKKRVSDSYLHDENNNFTRKKYGAPPKGLVQERMKRLKSFEQDSKPSEERDSFRGSLQRRRSNEPETTKEKLETLETPQKETLVLSRKDGEQKLSSPMITKIIPAKKTLQLNVRQFQQFRSELNTSPNGNVPPSHETKCAPPLKPLEINFNFKLTRKKKAYTQKQQTRSLTDITNVGKPTDKPTEKQILSPKNKYNEDKTDLSRQLDQAFQFTTHQSLHNIELTKKMPGEDASKNTKAIIKISSRTTKPNTAKIYIKSSETPSVNHNCNKNEPTDDVDLDKALKTIDKIVVSKTMSNDQYKEARKNKNMPNKVFEDLEAKYFKNDDGISHVQDIKTLRKKFEKSSFDSGFFGNNNSTDEENFPSSLSLEFELPKKTKTLERMRPDEQQVAKYRCNPIHKPVLTTNGNVYNASSPRLLPAKPTTSSLYNEGQHSYRPVSPDQSFQRVWSPDALSDRSSNSDDYSFNPPYIRRWGSQDLEPTQDKPLFIPRSAEIKRNILEQSKREQAANKVLEANNSNASTSQQKIYSKQNKQYSIQRTIVGVDPKFQRTASFGMTRKTRLAPPAQYSGRLLDHSVNRDKMLAFTQALGQAASRKHGSGSLI